MPRTWLTLRVDLVSGRGEDLLPRPGRVLIARPGMTFRALADAIIQGFARWELSHLHVFTLADGTRITMKGPWDDDEALDDTALGDTATKLSRLDPDEQFAFTFDLGDDWEHLCTVGPAKVDPHDVYGAIPTRPVAIDGWGTLPDQHGRRYEALDDRWWPGDGELAAVLDAAMGEGPVPEQVEVPVRLDDLTVHLGSSPFEEGTWYVDLRDGTWVCDAEHMTGIAPPEVAGRTRLPARRGRRVG